MPGRCATLPAQHEGVVVTLVRPRTVRACIVAALLGLLALAGAAPVTADPASVSGALPAGFRYTYGDRWHGWPVAPLHEEHPIRGGFLAPRITGPVPTSLDGGYHFGVDVAVDDTQPDRGAPAHRSHRVYAVEGGVVAGVHDRPGSPCIYRRLSVHHFSYWHVDPTVKAGTRVRAGDPIGWTCKGEWHVHLSEWAMLGKTRVWVNPLHRGGKLAPYTDTLPPEIRRLWLVAADGRRQLDPAALTGKVELLAQVDDPPSFEGWLERDPRLEVPDPPYKLAVTIRDANGRIVLERTAFQADRLPQTPFAVHYAPPTDQDISIQSCIKWGCKESARAYVFRPFSRLRRELWDTRLVAPGPYLVTLNAWDERGNVAGSTLAVTVLDQAGPG